MGRSFADDLAADATGVFLNPQEFGETWTHVRADGTTEPFTGVFEEKEPPPTQSNSGGVVVHRAGELSCPVTLVVNCDAGRKASRFTRSGESLEWIAVGHRVEQGLQIVRLAANVVTRVTGGFGGVVP